MADVQFSPVVCPVGESTQLKGTQGTRRGFDVHNESHGDIRVSIGGGTPTATIGKLVHAGDRWGIKNGEGLDFVAEPHVSLVAGPIKVYPLGNADPALGHDPTADAICTLIEYRTS